MRIPSISNSDFPKSYVSLLSSGYLLLQITTVQILKLLSMTAENFYNNLVEKLQPGDVLHVGKNGACYTFAGWYKGNLQFMGTQTKSISKAVLIAVKEAMDNNIRINAEWLRNNELESFASRMALIKSIIKKYESTEPG